MYGRLGQDTLSPADGAMATIPAPVESGAMATIYPSGECPPCPPPQIIYRDKIVEKRVEVPVPVPVPGPTQYIYIDRFTGEQVTVEGGGVVGDTRTILLGPTPLPTTGAPIEDQEFKDVTSPAAPAGIAGFPWWIVGVAAGAYYLMTRKGKR